MARNDRPDAEKATERIAPGWRTLLRPTLAVPIAVVVGLALTAVAFLGVREWEAGRLHRRFQLAVSEHLSELRHGLDGEVEILDSLRAFWGATGDVTPDQFSRFVGAHVSGRTGLLSLQWLQRVRALERDLFEATPRPDGKGNHVVVESVTGGPLTRATRRDEYFPVTFVEPHDGAWRLQAPGFDHAAVPQQRAALARALETGDLVAAVPLALTPFDPRAAGASGIPPLALVCYLPVFASGGVPPTPAERDPKLLGYVAALFQLEELFSAAAGAMTTDFMRLHVYADATFGVEEGNQLVWRNAQAAKQPPRDFDELRASSVDSVELHWSFAHCSFTALCIPTRQLREKDALRWSWFALGLGIALSGMAAAAVRRLTGDRRRLAREIRQFWRLSSEMLGVLDMHGRFRRMNPAWSAALGHSEEAMIERDVLDLVHADDRAAASSALQRLAKGASTLSFETRMQAADGSWRWIRWNAAPNDELDAIHVVARDVTDERVALAELERRATIDSLTGVLTRRALFEKLEVELHRARRYGSPLSVAVMDLDRFKEVNDRHGHGTGDAVLRRVGQLLQETVRDSDFVGRFGGDEFVLVMPQTPRAAAQLAAERMLRALHEDAGVEGRAGARIPLRVSGGVGELDETVHDADDLIARADTELYRAKGGGRSRVTP